MVSYEEGWHYLAVEKISTEFYCLNCLVWICLGQKTKLNPIKKYITII